MHIASKHLTEHLLSSMSVVEESFEYLDAPVERIAGADVPMPYSANLERMAVPQVIIPLHLLAKNSKMFEPLA